MREFVILEPLGNSSLLNAIVIVKRTSEDRCQRLTQNVLSVKNTTTYKKKCTGYEHVQDYFILYA